MTLTESDFSRTFRPADLYKVLRAHILPLTNCAFNKSGDRFITGSYDRTCKVWDTASGEAVASAAGTAEAQASAPHCSCR